MQNSQFVEIIVDLTIFHRELAQNNVQSLKGMSASVRAVGHYSQAQSRPQSSQFVGQSQSCWHDRSSLDDLDQPPNTIIINENFTKFSTGDFAASRHFTMVKTWLLR